MPIPILALNHPSDRVLDALQPEFAVEIAQRSDGDWHSTDPEQVRGVLNFIGSFRAEQMDRLPNLEIISHMGVGYDGIDVQAAIDRGIVVTHTRDVLNADVANFAFLQLLAASRQLLRCDRYIRNGKWEERPAPLTWSLTGKSIGIVGLGRIGRDLARKLTAFDVQVLYHGRHRQDVPYEYCPDLVEMARRCTALILLVPGGADTDGLIGSAVLDAIGPSGGLINTARGSVVDEPALIAALQDKRLGWAALDVFADEPRVPQALREMPNVILSPHVASATVETRSAMLDLVADNIRSWFLDGRARTPVPECDP